MSSAEAIEPGKKSPCSPQHNKTAFWLKEGIFDGVQNFRELQARIDQVSLEKDRGDVFEIFIEGYLQTQIINQCAQHWVTGNIPVSIRDRFNLPSHDAGIDGVYQTFDGRYVAYQAKYRQAKTLSFGEVSRPS